MQAISDLGVNPVSATRAAIYAIVAGIIGYFAWHRFGLMAIAPAAVFCWFIQARRASAAATMLLYYLAAQRELPITVVQYGPTDLFGAQTLGLCVAVLCALPWYLFWHRTPRLRALGAACALVLPVVPPLGILNLASPLMAAGAWFPGWGLWGIAALTGSVLCVCLLLRTKHAVGSVILVVAGVCLINAAFEPRQVPKNWISQNTNLPRITGDKLDQFKRFELLGKTALALSAAPNKPSVIVLPESILGRLTPGAAWLWNQTENQLKEKGVVLLTGVDVKAQMPSSHGWLNSLRSSDGQLVTARISAPIDVHLAAADRMRDAWWSNRDTLVVNQSRVSPLFCYEELLVWPTVGLAASKPDVIVAVANLWFAKNLALPYYQAEASQLSARLIGVGIIRSVNLPLM